MQPVVRLECFLKVTLQWGCGGLLWRSCWAVKVHGIVLLLIDWLIETNQKIEHHFLLSTLSCNSSIPYCLPWNFNSSWGECQHLSIDWSELPYDFQISVVLFDLMPKRAPRCHRIGGPCSQGRPWWKCLSVNPFLSSFYLQLREQHMHSQHKHTLARTYCMYRHTHTREYATHTRQTQHSSVMRWSWSGCVRPRSCSLIPLFP